MLFFTVLICTLSFFFIWRPYQQYCRQESERRFAIKYKNFKLIAVRRYYPTLQQLSFSEIEEKYNLDLIYQNIGRRLLQR